ncbi:hypothetical protein [Rheinheimera sp.]|uniref:hypothetical protein n=1 Tax=Rheinheimera sp. TaxID=1869214 RepID=UPI004047186C
MALPLRKPNTSKAGIKLLTKTVKSRTPANAQSSCAVRVGCLCLLAAYTGLARLAALANPNNGKLHLLKTTPANCDTASQPEPEKLLSEAKKNNAIVPTKIAPNQQTGAR